MNRSNSKRIDADDQCPLCQGEYLDQRGKLLRTNHDILSCLAHFRDKKQEYFVCLSVDSGHLLIARRVVSLGTLTATLVHPREVFAGPLTDRAASVIIAHNHPSGDAQPSRQDITMTQQLIAAGQILGIKLQDHFIVTAAGHYSFRGNSLI